MTRGAEGEEAAVFAQSCVRGRRLQGSEWLRFEYRRRSLFRTLAEREWGISRRICWKRGGGKRGGRQRGGKRVKGIIGGESDHAKSSENVNSFFGGVRRDWDVRIDDNGEGETGSRRERKKGQSKNKGPC